MVLQGQILQLAKDRALPGMGHLRPNVPWEILTHETQTQNNKYLGEFWGFSDAVCCREACLVVIFHSTRYEI